MMCIYTLLFLLSLTFCELEIIRYLYAVLCFVLLGNAGLEEAHMLKEDVGQDATPRADAEQQTRLMTEAEELLNRKEEELAELNKTEEKLTEERDLVKKERDDAKEELEDTNALKAEEEKKLRRKLAELVELTVKQIGAEEKLMEALECPQADLREKLMIAAALTAAEEKLKKKQKLDKLKAEHKATENKLKQERDELKDKVRQLEIECSDAKTKLREEAEKKLMKKQEDLDNLKAEHKKVTKERDEVKKELERTKAFKEKNLECTKADLLAREELKKASIELACKEVELQHAAQASTELERLTQEFISESMRRVEAEAKLEFLKKENVQMRRKCGKVDQLFRARQEVAPNEYRTLHSGNDT